MSLFPGEVPYFYPVIPVKAGIQEFDGRGIPVLARMMNF
jgi:hypothetical protein